MFPTPFTFQDTGSSSPAGYASPAESDTIQTPCFDDRELYHQKPTPAQIHICDTDNVRKTLFAPGDLRFPQVFVDSSPVDDPHSPFHATSETYVKQDDFPMYDSTHDYDPSSISAKPANSYISFSTDAGLYSAQFPLGHKLNSYFVKAYQLEDELGSGGYGFVMTAQNRLEGHEVAVKFIVKEKVPEHAWMEDETIGRLPTEVMLLSFIDHENIVKCLDLFEDSLYFYLVRSLQILRFSF